MNEGNGQDEEEELIKLKTHMQVTNEIFQKCEYCELPIEGPSVLKNIKVGLGVTLLRRPLHLQCIGPYRVEKQGKFLAYIGLALGILGFITGMATLLR
jgi:hypothetical protein